MASQILYTAVFLALGDFSECAKKKGPMDGYIVGGEYTTIDKFPHAVYLAMRCSDSIYLCGASVVNQRILITAAHCLFPCEESRQKIKCFAGHEHVKQAIASSKIEQFKCHDRYSDDDLTNDLAIAATKKPLPLGDKIKRIVIPIRFPDNVIKASVAGWGLIDDKWSRINTERLKTVDQELRDIETCVTLLGEMESGTFCAGEIENLENRPSMGDSGSGLIYKTGIQIGVVSYRVNTHPALMVYTNVTYFYPWIEQTAMDLYCKAQSNESNSTS